MSVQHKLVLYHYWRSSCSWRLRWALALKKISYQDQSINLLTGEQRSPHYLKLNPAGTVPCLVVDGTPMTESLAIIEWLEECYPGATSLLPQSPAERHHARRLAHTIASSTQPLQNLNTLKRYSHDKNAQGQWARHWIGNGLAIYEGLIQNSAATWSLGSQLSIADLCLVPQVYNAIRFGVDLQAMPNIVRIYRHAIQNLDCDQSAPHRQQGADPQAQHLLI